MAHLGPIVCTVVCCAVAARGGSVTPYPGQDATERTRRDPGARRALETPGRVFFTADFEREDWHKPFFDRYGFREGRLKRVTDRALVHQGRGSLECRLARRRGSVASACYWFPPGYDKVHLRWYCTFAPDFDQGHLMHFTGLAAVAGNNRYAGMGKAGVRPTGYDRFTTGFEPWRNWGRHTAPGVMNFYSYFPNMKPDPKMNKYWGNTFRPAKTFIPTRGQWHCLEIMLKANDPGESNGEQAAWIDGRLYAHFTGILWRRSAEVKIKRLYLGVYIHNSPKENVVRFDDVALSTGYIGAINGRSRAGEKTFR